MAGTATNVNIGPCWVTYNSVDLGFTKGGVKIGADISESEVTVDQNALPIDGLITGMKIKVTVPVAEWTPANLSLAFPGSVIVTGSGGVKKVVLKDPGGMSMKENAHSLLLHPTDKLANDKSEDFLFPKAFPKLNGEIAFDPENPKILELSFSVFYDDTLQGFCTFGDPSITAA
jgi:hypothetical protein